MTEFELHAFLEVEDDATVKPFYLKISAPKKAVDLDDWFCCVHAPALFSKDKEIFGIDPEQAKTLATDFVKSLLGNRRLIDAQGKTIIL